MKKRFIFILIILCLTGIFAVILKFSQKQTKPANPKVEDLEQGYHRIISLAPSITEVLFALDLGQRVVGVTDFCDYPEQAKTKQKVGGFYDTSYETILTLEPDLVIMLPEHEKQKYSIIKLGIDTLIVDHRDTTGIMESILTIGRLCGQEKKARQIYANIEKRLELIKKKTHALLRPKVMICVGRTIGSGAIEDVYICGRKGFYNEWITLAGGVNAYEGHIVRYPTLSGEGISRLNPDVIIEMVPDLYERGLDEGMVAKDWEQFSWVEAVKNQRIYIFGQDYVAIPGPRFIRTLEHMARVIHPEADWE